MNKFFRKIGNKSPKIHSPKFGIIDFRNITTERAFELWTAGFKDIGITPAGAKNYLSKMNATDLAQTIKNRTDLDDVLILSKLSKAAAVKKAKEEMITKLDPEAEKKSLKRSSRDNILVDQSDKQDKENEESGS